MAGPGARPFNQPWRTMTVQYPQTGLSTPKWARVKVHKGGRLIDTFESGIGIHRIPGRSSFPLRPPRTTRTELQQRRETDAGIRANERRAMDEAALRARRTQERSRPFDHSPTGTATIFSKRLQTRSQFQVGYRGPQTLGPRPNTTQFGRKILDFVGLQKQWQAKQTRLFGGRRLGGCVETTLLRMKGAHQSAYGKDILAGRSQAKREIYDAIGGTRTRKPIWKRIPKRLKYKGAPGALAYLGLGSIVEGQELWEGKADPGSPLQLWMANPGGPGHSGILERYIRDKKGRVEGLAYSDQHFDYKIIRKPSKHDTGKYIGFRFKKRD